MKMEKYQLLFFLLFLALAVRTFAVNTVIKREKVTSGTQFDDCKCTGDNKECIKIETHEDGKLKKTDLRCQCTKGWSGSDCKTEEVNECLKPEICDRRTSICLARLKDSYVCYCKEGFVEHVKSRICKDINECANPDHNPCSLNGPNEICINTFGSYKCQCKEGFIRANGKCVKKRPNECPPNQYMDANKRCRCRKTIARNDDGDICYDCNKNSIGLSQHSKFPDYVFKASSSFDWEHSASKVRIGSYSSWALPTDKVDKTTGAVIGDNYIEIDLRVKHFICAISVGPSARNYEEFVSTYQIAYMESSSATWQNDPKTYQGGTIAAAKAFRKEILTDRPLMRKIRIYPRTCHKGFDCSMRLELYGQRIDANGQCSKNGDGETFRCKCNKGYIGDGSTCREKPFRIIGKAGLDRYTYGKVLSVRKNRVKFLPDNAVEPVYGERHYDYAADVIPSAEQIVQTRSSYLLFRKVPGSNEFFWGVYSNVEGDTYNISLHYTSYDFSRKTTQIIPAKDGKRYQVKLDDLRLFERNADICKKYENSIFTAGVVPGWDACLCPLAGELPSGGRCEGENKYYYWSSTYDRDPEGTDKYYHKSLWKVDGKAESWIQGSDKVFLSTTADVFSVGIEALPWYRMGYGESVAGMQSCRSDGCPTVFAYGKIKNENTNILIQNGIFQESFEPQKLVFVGANLLCQKIAQCPINSTCVTTTYGLPSTYSCACNGPVIDNVCTKPIEFMDASIRRVRETTDLSILRMKIFSVDVFGEHTSGFVEQLSRGRHSYSLLDNMADATLFDEAPYWLRKTNGGETLYDLGHVGGRLLGEKDSVVFVNKNAPKGKSRFSLARKENVYKAVGKDLTSWLYSCREDNQCGMPGEGICVSQVWNYHYCLCAEGFRNFWGPKGETCVPSDYN